MKRYYQFAVWKRDYYWQSPIPQRRYATRYTVEADHEYDNRSFNFVASHLVLAERVMLFEQTHITHVAVYELVNGEWFSSSTLTHTLLPSTFIANQYASPVHGVRVHPQTDGFYGLTWKRNRAKGASYRGYFGACVGLDDCRATKRQSIRKREYVMKMDMPLAKHCWPFYASILAYLPQIQDDITSNKFGAMRYNGRCTSGRKISHVTDMSRHRLKQKKRGQKEYWIEEVLHTATNTMLVALQRYYNAMNNFNHHWGDGVIPDQFAGMSDFIMLSSLWKPLWKVLGGTNLDGHRGLPWDYLQLNTIYPTPADNSVKVASHYRQVHDCLRTLFNCHQWLMYYTRDDTKTVYDYHNPYYWRGLQIQNLEQFADAVYSDWNDVTDKFFKIADCINVLNSILVIDEPSDPARKGVKEIHPAFIPTAPAQSSIPGAVPFTPMIEVYPIAKDPYYFTESPPPPEPPEPDEIPLTESFPWDSGNVEDNDDPNYQQAMRNAVKTALAKLEGTRRWVGRIRKQIAYYRDLAIEKFAPQQDESQNPFGDPIEPPKLPW